MLVCNNAMMVKYYPKTHLELQAIQIERLYKCSIFDELNSYLKS